MNVDRYRIAPGAHVHLAAIDARGHDELDKRDGQAALDQQRQELRRLQELLYADGSEKVLVILQATDTGGKDGTIRAVFQGVNPQGVRVASFGVPSKVELSHDYLWRAHAHVPASGEIAIFNRSYYEDVLAVRVHDLVPKKRWERRYGHINDFERMLTDEGTTIRKFFLHITKDEQRERLQERIDDPTKRWKFNPADLDERKLWDQYQAAVTDMLERTSTDVAPWYVVPANRNWYRNLVVSTVLVDTLSSLHLRYPDAPPGVEGLIVD
jgi:PPK2 family polyphosphate:nucleotide phosphotransferase